MIEVDEVVLRSIAASLRTKADDLEAMIAHVDGPLTNGTGQSSDGEFDPLRDKAPIEPKKDRNQEGYYDPIQLSWCGFLLWGGLYAINEREGRYATASEARQIARNAGYHGNGAWTGTKEWTKGTTRDSQGGRMITERGKQWLRDYMIEVGRSLPADLPDPAS